MGNSTCKRKHPMSSKLRGPASMLPRQSDETGPCTAVPDDVGHPFAHSPGQDSVYDRGKFPGDQLDLSIDPRRFQQLPCTIQFTLQSRLSVSCNGFTHLAERLAGHPLDLGEFLRTAVGILLDQEPRQFALERDHRERMPQQIMQVTRQAHSLFLDLQASQFPACGMQSPYSTAHAGHADHIQTESSHQQHQRNEPPPIYPHHASFYSNSDEERQERCAWGATYRQWHS